MSQERELTWCSGRWEKPHCLGSGQVSQSWGAFVYGEEHFRGAGGLIDISRQGCEGAGWWDPSIKGSLRAQGQGLTHQAGLPVSAVREEVAQALREQGQGDKLEQPRHQAAGRQQGPGLRGFPRSSLGRQRRVQVRCILARTLPLPLVLLPAGLQKVCIVLCFFLIRMSAQKRSRKFLLSHNALTLYPGA